MRYFGPFGEASSEESLYSFANIYKPSWYFPDEELLRWAFPEDVWFHVDKLSSAHVYLRMREVLMGRGLDILVSHGWDH